VNCKPEDIALLVLTHEHIDHTGGAAEIRSQLKCQVAAHQAAIPTITKGDSEASAAKYYGTSLTPCPVDIVLEGDAGIIPIGGSKLHFVYTPGHTPGSIVLYFDDGERRVLFGQDLHGPFSPEWGSDIDQWRTSMQLVLALEADILCEGHYGIYRGKSAVRQFIFGLLEQQSHIT
jgi:glyoxylase-like metal-dependent hydrolase (beta-lactamase superfamily II)